LIALANFDMMNRLDTDESLSYGERDALELRDLVGRVDCPLRGLGGSGRADR
jgi:hypothetical protein